LPDSAPDNGFIIEKEAGFDDDEEYDDDTFDEYDYYN